MYAVAVNSNRKSKASVTPAESPNMNFQPLGVRWSMLCLPPMLGGDRQA